MKSHIILLLAATPFTAFAQTSPSLPLPRPVRLIVPYVPGGGTDTIARLIAPAVGEAVGQQVVVDNRPGAGSTIGTHLVVRAAPDGQTLGISDAALVTNPSLIDNLPYDTVRDLAMIVVISNGPMILVVNPSLPVKSVKDLVALARAQPGKLTYGSAGTGSATHLAAEQLRWAAQIDIQHIPYKGAGQSITELIGSHITMAFTSQSTAKPHVASGRLRALALTSAARSKAMPDVATFSEAGFAKVDTQTLTTLLAPAGTGMAFLRHVNTAVVRATHTAALEERFQGLGYEPETNTPEEALARVRAEIEKWRTILRSAGAKAPGNL